MADLFVPALAFIMRPENDGQGYHVTPGDDGGATAWGITYSTWQNWCRMHKTYAKPEVFEVLAKVDAAPVYRSQYWNACRCASLGPVGVTVFDMAVTSGPGNAAKVLQRAVGVTADGELGPETVMAANRLDRGGLNGKLLVERMAFYASLGQPEFLRGWNRRAQDCHTLVAELIG